LIGDAEVGEHFKAAFLQSLAAGPGEVRCGLVDDPYTDTAAGEVDSQRQAGGPGAGDEHVCDRWVGHARVSIPDRRTITTTSGDSPFSTCQRLHV
jgi:hypothetical protein